MNRWVQHNQNFPGSWPERDILRARANQVTEDLMRSTPDPLVWAHGDLHDKQIICTDGESPLGLLDFDAAARAEAARDLANLDVHLKLRLRLRLLTPERYLVAHTQVVAAANDLHVSPARFYAYADATRIRLACLYSFRPGLGSVASSLLDEQAPEQAREMII